MIDETLKKRLGYYLILLVISSVFFIGFPSEPRLLWLGVFSVCTVLLLFVYAYDFSFSKKKISIPTVLLILYAKSIFLGLLVSLYFGYKAEAWLRSVAGQLLLLLFIPFSFYLKSAFIQRKIINAVLVMSLAWCLWILFNNADSVRDILARGGRLTYYSLESVMPFPLVGFLISIFHERLNIYLRAILSLFFLIFAVLVGYKLILIIGFLMFMYRLLTVMGFFASCWVFITLVLCFFVFINLDVPIFKFYYDRLLNIGGEGDQSRLNEYYEVFRLFTTSPIFGVGYGFSVTGLDGEAKNYVHNYILFLLGGGGALGFSLVATFFLSVFLIRGSSVGGVRELSVVVLLALLGSTMTAASYKFLQFNLLTALFCALAYCSRPNND